MQFNQRWSDDTEAPRRESHDWKRRTAEKKNPYCPVNLQTQTWGNAMNRMSGHASFTYTGSHRQQKSIRQKNSATQLLGIPDSPEDS